MGMEFNKVKRELLLSNAKGSKDLQRGSKILDRKEKERREIESKKQENWGLLVLES